MISQNIELSSWGTCIYSILEASLNNLRIYNYVKITLRLGNCLVHVTGYHFKSPSECFFFLFSTCPGN
jgi:hypothetical protein